MSQGHRYKEIQLAQLRSFCLAATEGNFTSAAKALGLSASTVWQQVRALERELKAKPITIVTVPAPAASAAPELWPVRLPSLNRGLTAPLAVERGQTLLLHLSVLRMRRVE